mmetsp:Transcript_67059/g.187553  ORF Transcript_67059/g.187553 Transcript_67059/m.187553 type:complete len:342 (+) Transcript_67059:1324-2349(+)
MKRIILMIRMSLRTLPYFPRRTRPNTSAPPAVNWSSRTQSKDTSNMSNTNQDRIYLRAILGSLISTRPPSWKPLKNETRMSRVQKTVILHSLTARNSSRGNGKACNGKNTMSQAIATKFSTSQQSRHTELGITTKKDRQLSLETLSPIRAPRRMWLVYSLIDPVELMRGGSAKSSSSAQMGRNLATRRPPEEPIDLLVNPLDSLWPPVRRGESTSEFEEMERFGDSCDMAEAMTEISGSQSCPDTSRLSMWLPGPKPRALWSEGVTARRRPGDPGSGVTMRSGAAKIASAPASWGAPASSDAGGVGATSSAGGSGLLVSFDTATPAVLKKGWLAEVADAKR